MARRSFNFYCIVPFSSFRPNKYDRYNTWTIFYIYGNNFRNPNAKLESKCRRGKAWRWGKSEKNEEKAGKLIYSQSKNIKSYE